MRAEKLTVISAFDPAINVEAITAAQMGVYLKSRDMALITPYLRPGSTPTKFHLREIDHALWGRYILAADGADEQALRAFQCSVWRIENLYQQDGTFLPIWDAPDNKGQPMPEEMMQRVSPAECLEIGRVAWSHSFFHRRIECSFVPPHSFLTLLGARGFRPADASPSLPAKSSGEASPQAASVQPAQEPTALISATTANGSGSLTAATATGPAMEFAQGT